MKHTFQTSFARMLAVTSLAFAVPVTAMAFPGEHGKGEDCRGKGEMQGKRMNPHGGMPLMHELRHLGLSQAQKDRISEILHQQGPAQRERITALRNSEQELRALRLAPDYSESKARALIDQIARQQAELQLSRLQAERQALEILTPEQRKKLGEDRSPERENRRS